MTNFNEMGKVELRAACKAAGISYGKLNNDGMRAALQAKSDAEFVMPQEELAAQAPRVTLSDADKAQIQDEAQHRNAGAPGAVVDTPTPAPVRATGSGLKIEKNRDEQNGIKRPSVGGKCREIWDALDQYVKDEGAQPDSKLVKALADENGWNRNNASIEFYQWRKFHGIVGRQ